MSKEDDQEVGHDHSFVLNKVPQVVVVVISLNRSTSIYELELIEQPKASLFRSFVRFVSMMVVKKWRENRRKWCVQAEAKNDQIKRTKAKNHNVA